MAQFCGRSYLSGIRHHASRRELGIFASQGCHPFFRLFGSQRASICAGAVYLWESGAPRSGCCGEVSLVIILGTEIDKIRDEHPDWTEEECRDQQKRTAFAAFGLPSESPLKLTPGQKIRFEGERQRYTVRASNDRFAICTKPFNVKRTTLYTIIDFVRMVRGRENLIFGMGFETDEQCRQALDRLVNEESEVSYRHSIPLDIVKVFP